MNPFLVLYMFIVGIVYTVNNSKRDGVAGLLINFLVMPFIAPIVVPLFLVLKLINSWTDSRDEIRAEIENKNGTKQASNVTD